MSWSCRCIFFLILTFSTTILVAQPSQLPKKNIVFDQLPDNLGLGQSTINCMLQDREGYLWIGTWSGLIRYDGYSTKLFHSENGPDKLKSNKITSLHEDANGHIWIGTQVGGLFQYNKSADKFTQFIHDDNNPKSISNSSVWAIKNDADGNLWVGTENGLNMFNPTDSSFKAYFSHYDDSTSLSNSFITDMYLSSDNELWVATENGLNKVRQDDKHGYFFERYVYGTFKADGANHYLHNYIFKVRELTSGNSKSIWYTTTKGLKKLENGKITNYNIENKEPAYSYFRSLYVANTDHPYILIGSEMGLSFFDPGKNKFTRFYGNYDKSVNLSHNTVTSLFFDNGGVLWVGTKKGLNKYNSYGKDFKLYLTAEFDKTNSIITGFCKSGDDGIWISTIGGGLFKFIHNTFTHYTIASPDENSFTEFIQTLYRDSRGTLWIGTAGGGVYSVDERDIKTNTTVVKKFNHYKNNNPVVDSHVMSFTEDDQHAIWVGLWNGGVNKIDINGKVSSYPDVAIKDVPVVSLFADRSGVLWMGTRGSGLFRATVKNGTWQLKQFKHNESDNTTLVNDFINSIYEDHAGSMWI
ncbi:MAG TPA: two-component regulator propeller domain-containing protein, partial [Cyclobacteriaceae bacterium]